MSSSAPPITAESSPPCSTASRLSAARGSETARRLIAAAVALVAAATLSVAAVLDPSPEGLGTHQQLGVAPCGWIILADLPCPTCGMTTAFAHAADGNFPASFAAQPLGFLLALAAAMAILIGAYVAMTGSRVAFAFARLWCKGAAWGIAALVLVSWGYKIISYKGWLE